VRQELALIAVVVGALSVSAMVAADATLAASPQTLKAKKKRQAKRNTPNNAPSAPENRPGISSALEPSEITAGQHVILHADHFPLKGAQVFLKRGDEKICSTGIPAETQVKDDQTLLFLVPSNTAAKSYPLCVVIDNKDVPVSGSLTVQPDSGSPVRVDAIYPLTNYPVGKGFDFEIAGKNFARLPQDNVIEVLNQGLVPLCASAKNAGASPTFCLTSVEVISPARLKVRGFYPSSYYGPIQIRVHVGNNASDPPVSVTFAAATPQWVAIAVAAVFGALAVLFVGLLRKGLGSSTIDGQKLNTLTSLFLDRETNSYSLSKLQVLAWTAVIVYAYIYLFLCRTLIQGDFSTFPGVPQNIPQLFFVAAGTTVAAAAITVNRGSKGAGPIGPSMADFISTGGLVAGDRFQFFIWTIVGCMGYVYLVVRNDPAKLAELPTLPDNFLYLMGVSSAGYLGGKLVRKPGPVIKALSISPVADVAPANAPAGFMPPILTLNLKGENLELKATVKIDGKPLRGDMFWVNGIADPQQAGFCTEVNVSLNDARTSGYLDGSHILTLVNSDSQAAEVKFPIDPMSIDPVATFIPAQPPPAGAADVPASLVITGKSFVTGITAEWTPEGGQLRQIPAVAPQDGGPYVVFESATKLRVNRDPEGMRAGKGKLTLVSPIGLRVSQTVNIVQQQ